MPSIKVVPMGAVRMNKADAWKERPVVLRYFAFKDAVRKELPGYVLPRELHIIFGLPMPKSWPKKKRAEKLGQPHDQKPDIDNLCKAFMDVWKEGEDDKVVYSLVAQKYWSEEGYITLP